MTDRSINDIAQELISTGFDQRQISLLVELLAAKGADNKAPPKRPRATRTAASPLPEDWGPNDLHYRWALDHGKGTSWVHGIAEDMRNWAASKGESRASWDGTFSTFMKKALEHPATQTYRSGTSGYANGRLGGGYA